MDNSAVLVSNVTKKFGDFVAVDALTLSIGDGEFFSLLGPSGCGKTTTLRMIAGFEQPTEGQIYIMGQPVAGIPAYRRPVNTVFQSYSLFPHMTVEQNVAFGLQMAKVEKAQIAQRVTDALAQVQMTEFGKRKPNQLSGGQQQRVALARALVNQPKVLLLDEPLGALDLKLRKAMQLELKHIQNKVGITFVYVTHDQEEALTMSDRIAVMDHGVVQQMGTPREIYEEPVNRFVADFIGETNFVRGRVDTSGETSKETVVLTAANIQLRGHSQQSLSSGQQATLAIRPEKLSLYPLSGADDQLAELRTQKNGTLVEGRIDEVIYIGTDTRYRIALLDDQYLFVRIQNLGGRYDRTYAEGDGIYLYWDAENAQVLTQ